MSIKQETYIQKPEYNFLHQRTQFFCVASDVKLSEGLCVRLVSYAKRRALSLGFHFINDWTPTVGCNDVTSDVRDYYVDFTNEQGKGIQLCGIMTNSGGWPSIDHGFSVID